MGHWAGIPVPLPDSTHELSAQTPQHACETQSIPLKRNGFVTCISATDYVRQRNHPKPNQRTSSHPVMGVRTGLNSLESHISGVTCEFITDKGTMPRTPVRKHLSRRMCHRDQAAGRAVRPCRATSNNATSAYDEQR